MLCQSVVAGDFLLAKYSHGKLIAGNWYEVSRVDHSYPSQIPRYYLKEIADSSPWHPYWFGLTDTVGSETIVGAEAHIRRAGVSCVPGPHGPTPHSDAVRMLALHRDLLLSENEALKAKIRLAKCQCLGAGGSLKPEEIVQAMLDVLDGTYSSISLIRKADT